MINVPSEGEQKLIYRKIDKEYKLEDITNALIHKHNYKEEDITRELLENILARYQKGLDNDDSWVYILDAAITDTI